MVLISLLNDDLIEMKMIDKNLVITKSPTLVYSCMMIGRDKKGFEGLGLGN